MSVIGDQREATRRSRAGTAVRRHGALQDLLVAVVPMVLAVYQGLAQPVEDLGAHGRSGYVAIGVMTAAPLLARRAAPLLSLVLVTAMMIVGPLLHITISNSMLTALALSCYSYGCYGRLPAAVGWILSLAFPIGWVLAVPPDGRGDFLVAWGAVILVVYAWLALAAYAGHVQRERLVASAEVEAEASRVQDRTQELAALDVARERSRIAEDLQLIVRRAVDDLRRRAGEASAAVHEGRRGAAALLDAVAESGRQALTEMRRLLGVLREDADGPREDAPEDVQRWQADAASAGVALSVDVPPDLADLPPVAVAAARRTVEVATALAHSGDRRASVTAWREDGRLLVNAVVATEAGDAWRDSSAARDLEALRERLRLTRGHLSVEYLEDRTVLDVALPIQRAHAAIPAQQTRHPRSEQRGPDASAAARPLARRLIRPRDVALAVVVAGLGIAEIVLRPDYGHHQVPEAVLPGILVMLGFAGLLLVRERWPWPGLVAVVALTAVVGFDVVRFSGALHIVVAMYLFHIASRSTLRSSLLALGAVTAGHLPVLIRMDWSCLCVVVVLGIAGSATAIGRVARHRDELNRLLAQRLHDLEGHRERQVELAVTEERRRVAREMHDVVAHRLSVAVLQAGAAAGVVEHDRAQARELLDNVVASVDDLALELAALVDPSEPAVDGDFDVAALVEQERMIGRSVALVTDSGTVPTAGIRLVAYRIVQEALTNARKHAPDAEVVVRMRHDYDGGLELEVRSGAAISEQQDLVGTGGGLGLRGMRERAAVVGGRIDTGATPDGGFCVRAWLPEAARV